MFYKVNFSIFLLAMFVFSSCKSIEISEVKKELVIPGYKLGVTRVNYSATIKTAKEFRVESIKIDKIEAKINDFTIIKLPSGKIKSNTENLEPGSYYVGFSVLESLVDNKSIDTLVFTFLIKNRTIKFKKKTTLEDPLLSK